MEFELISVVEDANSNKFVIYEFARGELAFSTALLLKNLFMGKYMILSMIG